MSGSSACLRVGTDSSNVRIEGAPRIMSAPMTSRRAGSVRPASPSSPIPTITNLDRALLNVAIPYSPVAMPRNPPVPLATGIVLPIPILKPTGKNRILTTENTEHMITYKYVKI